ncbi:MAG TPA: gephyrin-like molybdotransferase Glp [Phnomibacter sp.]|nr:gephyrin-like molybdotransferase Glp [Phnomibacter sp.]
MEQMISVDEARAMVVEKARKLPAEKVSLKNATGLVLAADVVAMQDIPAYPQSSMDGYALRYDGVHWPLKLVGEMAAGSSKEFLLKPGEAVRIFTGAAVPAGADTVVMQEKVRVDDAHLHIEDPGLMAGANVRPVGSEVSKGALAMPAGALLTPAAIGFLAGIGITEVEVVPLPKISVIVTGNELQAPGEPLGYGQVYEANSFTLLAALQQAAIEPLANYRSGDDLMQLTEILQNALEVSDVVLITGGVSVGAYDLTSPAFDRVGVQKIFHKIRQKPGKPILFGTKEEKLVFGLPGNPASVLSCYYQYVLPALSVLSARPLALKRKRVPLRAAYKKPAGLTHFLKGSYDGSKVELLSGQESYKLNSFARANCMAEIPEGATDLPAGHPVTIHVFSEG